MKRSDVRNAYDHMNPTQKQRDKMYRAIMKKAERQSAQKTVAIRRLLRIPAAVAMAVIVVIGAFAIVRNEDFAFTQKPAEPTEYQMVPPAHEALLEIYRSAIREGWSEEQCQEKGISTQLADVQHMEEKPAYVLLDIDGNGIKELIIGHGMPHYFYVWDLYTFDSKGQAVLLHTDVKNHVNCHLYENGIIGTEYVSKTEAAFSFFRLNESTLFGEDILTCRNDFWYDEMAKQQISQEEANEIVLNKYQLLDVEPTYLTNGQTYNHKDFEADEQYRMILDKYYVALAEHWDPGKCMENDISLMVGYYGGIVPQLGYNRMDLNGDGKDELIITDGTNIYDLYTISRDEEIIPIRLINATERQSYFLTTDGYIYSYGSGGALLNYYALYTVGRKALEFEKGYIFDSTIDPDNTWYHYDGEDRGDPCTTAEAAAFTDSVHFADLVFTPFE